MALKLRKADQKKDRQTDSKKQQPKNSRKKNREFAVVMYTFLVIFVCMMAYFAYFEFVRSEDFINNPYNKRQDLFAQKVVRGEIRSADGYTLADTAISENGGEVREYPCENMFAHVVGFATNGKAGLESTENFKFFKKKSV